MGAPDAERSKAAGRSSRTCPSREPAKPTRAKEQSDSSGLTPLAAAVAAPAGQEPPAAPVSAVEAAEEFLAELVAHWRRAGKSAFDAALTKDPVRYMNLAAQVMHGSERRRPEARDDLVALLSTLNEKE